MPPTDPLKSGAGEHTVPTPPQPRTPAEGATALEDRVRDGAETFDFTALLRRTNAAQAQAAADIEPPIPRVIRPRLPAWPMMVATLALVVFVGPLWVYLASSTPAPNVDALERQADALAANGSGALPFVPATPSGSAASASPAPPAPPTATAGVPGDEATDEDGPDVIPQSEINVPAEPAMQNETDPRYLFEPVDGMTLKNVMSKLPAKLKAEWRGNGGNSRNTVFARGGDTHLDLAYFSSGGTVRRIWQTWPYREWADSWRILGHIPEARSIRMVLLRKSKGLEVRVRDRRGRTWRSREVNPNTDRCYWSEFKPD